jgi:hypothetical protein
MICYPTSLTCWLIAFVGFTDRHDPELVIVFTGISMVENKAS